MTGQKGGFMDDLISREKAIEALLKEFERDTPKAIRAKLTLENLPSAQPETHEERTETHACDTVSRQAVIEAINKIFPADPMRDDYTQGITCGAALANIYVAQLPSAQPDIIRCNACKHWTQTTGNMRGFGLGDCDYINAKLVNCNGFCYWAERKTDG